MYKVIVFAGTTEGYEISRFLGENQIPVLACVATEYGSRSLKESSSLHVQAGRLDENEMKELFSREKPELVLDATHPYAAEVTRNIRKPARKPKSLIRGSSVQAADSRTLSMLRIHRQRQST